MSAPAKPHTRPIDQTMLQYAARQHIAAADKLAAKIANCAETVRKHLTDGQLAGPAARQIAVDVADLIAELAKLGEDGQFARLTRQRVA